MSLSPHLRTLAAAVLALIGCHDPTSPAQKLRDATNAARARWSAAALNHYTFDAHRMCFCVPEAIGPATIVVNNGQVSSVRLVSTGAALEPAQWFDINALFDLIEREIDAQPDQLEVTFDAVRGYPTRVKYGDLTIDAGADITVTAFSATP